jgi:hypothetical protein
LHATSLLFRLKQDLFEYIKIKDFKRQFFEKKADKVPLPLLGERL